MNSDLLQCYNRGCGAKYDADKNTEDSCRHHPGEPFFHDAYKGWSCCNKKCTDFTEFLNIKGCTLSKHSNVKPTEPEKRVQEVPDVDVVEVGPLEKPMKRPPYDTEMVIMKPNIAPSVQLDLQTTAVNDTNTKGDEVPVGTSCKNKGCTMTYEDPSLNDGVCKFHPGVPIFHEGLKFWSCCQKRTTDFDTFLSQIGCETGKHTWKKESDSSKTVECRWDFHQTGTHVFVSIYAKMYSAKSSVVKLNPVRLYVNLVFPQEGGASFYLDAELDGIIDVEQSQVSMLGTKVEIKMKKAEPRNWLKLECPSKSSEKNKAVNDLTPKVAGVDLDDL